MYDKRFAAQIILSRTCMFSACLTCMWLEYDSPLLRRKFGGTYFQEKPFAAI